MPYRSKKNVQQAPANSARLYHGSPVEGLVGLEPRKTRVIPDAPQVFATPNRLLALSFAAPWNNEDFDQSTVGDDVVMTERRPGVFDEKYLGRPGWLYRVPSEGFRADPRLMRLERVRSAAVPVASVEKIQDVAKALLEGGLKLRRYPEFAQKSTSDGARPTVRKAKMASCDVEDAILLKTGGLRSAVGGALGSAKNLFRRKAPSQAYLGLPTPNPGLGAAPAAAAAATAASPAARRSFGQLAAGGAGLATAGGAAYVSATSPSPAESKPEAPAGFFGQLQHQYGQLPGWARYGLPAAGVGAGLAGLGYYLWRKSQNEQDERDTLNAGQRPVRNFKMARNVVKEAATVGAGGIPSRAVASTIGQIPGLLNFLYTNRAVYSPQRKDHEDVAQAMSEGSPEELQNTAVRLGGTRTLDDLYRVWTNPRTSILGKAVGTVGTPTGNLLASLFRSPLYNPYADTATQFYDSPAVTSHLLGRAIQTNRGGKDFGSRLERDLYSLFQPFPGVGAYHLGRSNQKSLEALQRSGMPEGKFNALLKQRTQELTPLTAGGVTANFAPFLGPAAAPAWLGATLAGRGAGAVAADDQYPDEWREAQRLRAKKPAGQKSAAAGVAASPQAGDALRGFFSTVKGRVQDVKRQSMEALAKRHAAQQNARMPSPVPQNQSAPAAPARPAPTPVAAPAPQAQAAPAPAAASAPQANPDWMTHLYQNVANMDPHLRNSLIGGGIGATVGGLTNGWGGALAGGALGAGAGALSPYAMQWWNQDAAEPLEGVDFKTLYGIENPVYQNAKPATV